MIKFSAGMNRPSQVRGLHIDPRKNQNQGTFDSNKTHKESFNFHFSLNNFTRKHSDTHPLKCVSHKNENSHLAC